MRTPTLMDPRRLDEMPAATPAEPPDDGDAGDPAAAVVDLLAGEIERRVQVVRAAAGHLPQDAVTLGGALTRLREAGVELVAAVQSDHPTKDTPRLAHALRRVNKALSAVEDLVWVGLARELAKSMAKQSL